MNGIGFGKPLRFEFGDNFVVSGGIATHTIAALPDGRAHAYLALSSLSANKIELRFDRGGAAIDILDGTMFMVGEGRDILIVDARGYTDIHASGTGSPVLTIGYLDWL